MSELEIKRRNRRESNQIQDGMVSLNPTEPKPSKVTCFHSKLRISKNNVLKIEIYCRL